MIYGYLDYIDKLLEKLEVKKYKPIDYYTRLNIQLYTLV